MLIDQLRKDLLHFTGVDLPIHMNTQALPGILIDEVDGQQAKLIKDKWGGNEVLTPTLDAIGEEFPSRGRRLYFPDASGAPLEGAAT